MVKASSTRTVKNIGVRARSGQSSRIAKPATKSSSRRPNFSARRYENIQIVVPKPARSRAKNIKSVKTSKKSSKSAKTFKAINTPHKTVAKKTSRAPKKAVKPSLKNLQTSEKSLLFIISVSACAVIAAFIFEISWDPVRDTEKLIARLADDYYTEYLYPSTLRNQFDNPEQILSTYAAIGLPDVRLRQLLIHNDAKEANQLLSNQYYFCDTNRTTLRYYPTAPYGPRDYRIEYKYSCTGSQE